MFLKIFGCLGMFLDVGCFLNYFFFTSNILVNFNSTCFSCVTVCLVIVLKVGVMVWVVFVNVVGMNFCINFIVLLFG